MRVAAAAAGADLAADRGLRVPVDGRRRLLLELRALGWGVLDAGLERSPAQERRTRPLMDAARSALAAEVLMKFSMWTRRLLQERPG